MKSPFTILTVLFLLLGAPLGLMQYHSRAAFIQTPTNSSLGVAPGPQFSWHSDVNWHVAGSGGLLAELASARMTASNIKIGVGGGSPATPHFSIPGISRWALAQSLRREPGANACRLIPRAQFSTNQEMWFIRHETQHAKWFTALPTAQEDDRVIAASANAIVTSWATWLRTFQALSARIVDLRDYDYREVWQSWQRHAVADDRATDADEVDRARSLASVISAFGESPYQKCLADQRQTAAIPGLFAGTAAAIAKSATTWQPMLVPRLEQLKNIPNMEFLASWRERFGKPTTTKSMAARYHEVLLRGMIYPNTIGGEIVQRVASFWGSYRPNWLASRNHPAGIPSLMSATGQAVWESWATWKRTLLTSPAGLRMHGKLRLVKESYVHVQRYVATHLPVSTRVLPSGESDSATTARAIIASCTPLPADAAVVWGTVNFPSPGGVLAAATVGHAVTDLMSGLGSPAPRITKLASHAIWLPVLARQLWRL